MTSPAAKKLVIAIDGPAGAGKSTVAWRLARTLGYVNIDTGAMYRALALKAIECDVDAGDGVALTELAQKTRIVLQPAVNGNRVLLDGINVTERIRERDVSEAASRVSVHPRVREWMVARQRELGAGGGVVMEGRDIGTQVFPQAEVKIFLDADPVVRGERRYRQHPAAVGESRSAQVQEELQERDQRDRTRAASPLQPAADAVILDTTQLSLDEVMERVEKLVRERTRERAKVDSD